MTCFAEHVKEVCNDDTKPVLRFYDRRPDHWNFPVWNACTMATTTNAHDQAEAAKLKARLEKGTSSSAAFERVPSVSIDDGAHKYVLMCAENPSTNQEQFFVISRRGAAYHRNAAEPMVERLESSGYSNINITGGGRLFLDEESKKISIFGFSYSFGQADHTVSRRVVLEDDRYKDYDVTTSNEGY